MNALNKIHSIVSENSKACLLIGLTILLWLGLYWDALASAIKVWYISEIFTHGFFVLPGAIYLIWREQHNFIGLPPKNNFLICASIIGTTAIGMLGFAGDIRIFTHFAAFATLPLILWGIVGTKIALRLWFPLLFIFFSIPIGEELIPFLQEITADMSVFMLKLTGIPIFRNGLYIEIPEGRFVVAEACSGVRFFIGSIVFGAVYAYISYKSWFRRGFFMFLAISVPVIANSIRVFGIILVGHFSNMEHATGADHLVYGWVFFAIVLFLLIVVGEFMREKIAEEKQEEVEAHPSWKESGWHKGLFIVSAIFVLSIGWKFAVQRDVSSAETDLSIDESSLVITTEETGWEPIFPDASSSFRGNLNVLSILPPDVFIAWYASDSDKGELVASKNRPFRVDSWSRKSENVITLNEGSVNLEITRLILASPRGSKRLIYYWYELPNKQLANSTKTKLHQAFDRLLGGTGEGGIIMLSIPYSGEDKEAEEELRGYLIEHLEALRTSLPL